MGISPYKRIPSLSRESQEKFASSKWREIPIDESDEPLVPLNDRFKIDPVYYNHGLPNTRKIHYAREEVFRKLEELETRLPRGHRILIFDAHRTFETQERLYRNYFSELIGEFPEAGEEELHQLTQRFISLPSIDPTCPSPHMTGGAVDLTIVNSSDEPLNMGTEFDSFTENAFLHHFETKTPLTEEGKNIRGNRRMLYELAQEVGFQIHPNEWWHLCYGDQLWAFLSGEKRAIYGIEAITD